MIFEPDYKLTWNGKDLKKDLSAYLLSLNFMDREEGESDELEFVLDDKLGLWRNDYYPRKGDPIELELGWVGGEFTPCGTFQIDEPEVYRGIRGDTLTVRALSAIITSPLRSKGRKRYEKITLKRLAAAVAAEMKMEATGIVDNITLPGVSRHKETALAFLRRVSVQYGYVFTIKSNRIVFTKAGTLQTRASIGRFDASDFESCRVTDSSDLQYKSAQHDYWDAHKKKKISYKTGDGAASKKNDILFTDGYVANDQQAEQRAKAAWLKANNGTVSGRIEFAYGASSILAGNNIELTRLGKLSGLYHISNTTHSVSPGSGARLSADVFKVGEIAESLY